MTTNRLIDRYSRHLNYLRISITDRCNLRCVYCVPRATIQWLPHEEVLRYEEILRILGVGVALGITKVRVTGGEPLVRKGVYRFLNQLGGFSELSDLSLTTNGVLLKQNAERIKAAGIHRLNVSLDTLEGEKFKAITGRDHFREVWEGILLAHELGFFPIKINVVAMNGVNDKELKELARLSFAYPFHIRFIEYMPVGKEHLDANRSILAEEIIARIAGLGRLVPLEKRKNDGPAERFCFEGAKGEIGIIRPMSHHFCHRCNRLRLTASGALRPCLLSDYQVDLKGPMRGGCSDKDLEELFLKAVRFKPLQHHIDPNSAETVRDQMCSIGG